MHNLNLYYGNNKPSWEENIRASIGNNIKTETIKFNFFTDYEVYLIENAISNDSCEELINKFDKQEKYTVGVDGISNDSNVGSYRSMGWMPVLARDINKQILLNIMPKKINHDYLDIPLNESRNYDYIGSTPWFRFMKYKSGGKHTPHYDCSYINENEKYITLYSWVLFLNSIDRNDGGKFQFIDDEQQYHSNSINWDKRDHTKMSTDVICSIRPVQGSMLIFPHWLCHQVEEYTGNDSRYIIRGDVAYGY
jgi:hypothetical protein